MIYICVICMAKRPPLMFLTPEHHQLLEAIVSRCINTTELRSSKLLVCGECKLLMQSVYSFQQTALAGVKNLLSLQRVLSKKTFVVVAAQKSALKRVRILPKVSGPETQSDSHTVVSPVRESNPLEIQNVSSTPPLGEVVHVEDTQPAPVVVKEEPNPEPPAQGESVFVAVPKYDIANSLKEEVHIKEELQSDPEPERDRDRDPDRDRDRDSESTLTCESDYGGPDDIPDYQTRMPVISHIRSYHTDVGRSKVFPHRPGGRPRQSTAPDPPDPGQGGKRKRKERCRVNYCFNPRKPRPKRSYECKECALEFTGRPRWRYHQETMHSTTILECDICGKRYNNRPALKQHKYSKHKMEDIDNLRSELFCVECQMQFPHPSVYRNHMMTLKHAGKDHYSFECEHCKRKFPTKLRLQKHIKCIHFNQKHKCNKCDKSYATRRALNGHVTRAHEKLKVRRVAHVCHLCGDSFTVIKSLREHLLRHAGARPHRCPLCPATFTFKAALYNHNRFKHLKVRGKSNKKMTGDKA